MNEINIKEYIYLKDRLQQFQTIKKRYFYLISLKDLDATKMETIHIQHLLESITQTLGLNDLLIYLFIHFNLD